MSVLLVLLLLCLYLSKRVKGSIRFSRFFVFCFHFLSIGSKNRLKLSFSTAKVKKKLIPSFFLINMLPSFTGLISVPIDGTSEIPVFLFVFVFDEREKKTIPQVGRPRPMTR